MRRRIPVSGHPAFAYFNPRTPCGVLLCVLRPASAGREISIHAPLTGCDDPDDLADIDICDISIHAPLTGCDMDFPARSCILIDISIHAPLTGCDHPAE
nr:MAG TPA: hypothetical protein [Caudoviricetes sp.]